MKKVLKRMGYTKTKTKTRVATIVILIAGFALAVAAAQRAIKIAQIVSYDTLPGVELKMPGYLGEELRHPQKYFAGRKITIAKDTFVKATLQYANGSSKIEKELQSTETKGDRLIFELPMDLPEKSQLQLLLKNKNTQKTETKNLNIYNPKTQLPVSVKKSMKSSQAVSNIKDGWVLSNKYLLNDGGFEMVMAGQPNNSQNLIINSKNNVLRTTNGWESWLSDKINDGSERYPMDGDLDIDKNGNFVLPGLFPIPFPKDPKYTIIGGGIHFGNVSGGSLTNKVIKDTGGLDNLTKDILLASSNTIFDYPRIARHDNDIYVSVNGLYFNTYGRKTGVLISKDGGSTFKEYGVDEGSAIRDMEVDASGGRLYAVTLGEDSGSIGERSHFAKLIIFDKASDAFIYKNIDKTSYKADGWWLARVSQLPSPGQLLIKSLITYQGPVITIDKTNSLYKGRIYVAYAKPEKAVTDSNGEYKTYGYNFDIFLVYSDDKGENWSNPVKVNDDTNSADQYFPSISIDEDGLLHMSFMDHRDNLDTAEVNLYYTYSKDGGKTFASNIKISENPIPIYNGGNMSLGDYSYNLAAYRGKVYFGYPCVKPGNSQNYIPDNICLSTLGLSKSINLSVNSGITVTSDSGNINCAVSGENCSATYPINTKVILTAVTAIPGKIKWTGECVVSSNATNDDTCTINSLDADKNITATFTSNQPPSAPSSLSKNYDPARWTVTVTAPASSITDPENDNRKIECFKNEAKEPISISSGESSLLSKTGPWTYAFMIPWGSDDTSSHIIYCFGKDEVGAYSTNYKAIDVGMTPSAYTVTVSSNSDLIQVKSNPAGTDQSKIGIRSFFTKSFPVGTKVTLTAVHTTPGDVAWSDGCIGSGDTCTIESLDSIKDVTVTFVPASCGINISASKSPILKNKPLYLVWDTSNAVSCTSQYTSPYPRINNIMWVDGETQSLRNNHHSIGSIKRIGTYIYTLNCKNIVGDTCSASAQVKVVRKIVNKKVAEPDIPDGPTCGSNSGTIPASSIAWSGNFCNAGDEPTNINFPNPGESAEWTCDDETECTATREIQRDYHWQEVNL